MQMIRDFMNHTVGETAVDGRVVPVGRNGEAIVFEIPMGWFKLVCIANIPEDGRESAPVYIKMKLGDNAVRRAQFSNNNRRTRIQHQDNNGSDDQGDFEEVG
jgi:hypothetical protein